MLSILAASTLDLLRATPEADAMFLELIRHFQIRSQMVEIWQNELGLALGAVCGAHLD